MNLFALAIVGIVLIVDIYVYRGFKNIFPGKKNLSYSYLAISVFTYAILLSYIILGKESIYLTNKVFVLGFAQAIIFTKIILLPFILITDIIHVFDWLLRYIQSKPKQEIRNAGRFQFISQLGLVVGGTFFGSLIYGMVKGAYRLTIRRVTVKIKDLPAELNGFKIVQISDAHLGSFASTQPIEKAVHAINQENADLFVFTGDLVNDKATEALPYIEILKDIQAKYGKYTILGNHDYGMYVDWNSEAEKQKNILDLIEHQKNMGWKMLLNENDTIEVNGKKLSIIGVEYWGRSARWGQFGDIDKALLNLPPTDFKLLLTHDPTHWDMIISQNSQYQNLPLALSGHTHGFQFGIEIPGLKWSPSKYIYPHWAGLYTQNKQYLYVNRGLGFLGFPGRVGIYPEITVLTLENE